MATETKERKPRKSRRNYSKEFERLAFYLETIIRVKDDGDAAMNEYLKGQLKAYRDVVAYIEGK
jgi:hypothetical protein